MKKSYLLRLLTLVIYFLPFSFFYSGCEGDAYNKAEAAKLIREDSIKKAKHPVVAAAVADSTKAANDSSVTETNNSSNIVAGEMEDTTTLKYKADKIKNTIGEHALMPTKESISALGVTVVFVNMFGRICIILSIALALLSLIAERFFRYKNKLIKNLLLFNLLCVIAFTIDGLINKVDLRFGVWCLIVMLLIQVFLEIKRPPETPTTT